MNNCQTCVEVSMSTPSCTLCSASYIFKNSLGVNLCEYTTCPQSCTNCTIASPGIICNTCNIGYFMQPSAPRCITDCPYKYYGDTNDNRCKLCITYCDKCDMNGCIECTISYYLQPDKTCESTCPIGYYTNISARTCDQCPDYCYSCKLENTIVVCIECENTYFMKADNTCSSNCEEKALANPKTKKCEKCSIQSCYTCELLDDLSHKCIECKNGLYLHDIGVDIPCISECPPGYFGDLKDNIRICSLCPEVCKVCKNEEECYECKGDDYLQPMGYDPVCDTTCPEGYYSDTYQGINVCRNCQDRCKRCNNYDTCLECDDGYFLQHNGPVACHTTCEIGFYASRIIPFACRPCFSNCLECDESICYKCKNQFIAKPPPVDISDACLPCSKNCISCEYIDSRAVCIECETGFYIQPLGYDTECEKTCPDGYYTDMESSRCKECPMGKYGAGNECLDCVSPCTVCSRVDKCSECIENAIVENDRCDCLSNFEFDGIECIESYLDLDLEFRNNTLLMKFEYPLKENLNSSNILLKIDQTEYSHNDFSLRNINASSIYLLSEIIYQNTGKTAFILFNNSSLVRDIFNHRLFYNEYLIYIPTDLINPNSHPTSSNDTSSSDTEDNLPSSSQIKHEQTTAMESSTDSTIKGSIGVSFLITLFNMNLNSMWALLNTIQILTYLPILNISLPPRTLGVCKAFSSFNVMPNILSFFITESGPKLDKRFYEGGIESNQFLLNTGKSLTLLGIISLGYLIIKISNLSMKRFSSESKLKTFLARALKNMEWNIFIRFYIETYLEFSFSAMLNLSYYSLESFEQLTGFILSLFFLLLTFTTPIILLLFLLEHSQDIYSENSSSNYNSLHTGLKPSDTSLVFNVIFLIRRFLYSVVLIYLGYSAHIQIILSSLTSLFPLYYILYHKPHSSIKEAIFEIIGEGCTFLAISLLYAYSFRLEGKVSDYLDWVLVILLYSSFLTRLLVSIIEVIWRVSIKVIGYLRSQIAAKLDIMDDTNIQQVTVTVTEKADRYKID